MKDILSKFELGKLNAEGDIQLRDLAADPRRAEGVHTAELALIGQSFSPLMITDVLEPIASSLKQSTSRPFWLLTAGMGSELSALKDLGARPSVIYCAEIRHDAVEVLKNGANEVRAAALER